MPYTELYHHGILGQKWGVRRFQNADGSLTDAGRKRYYKSSSGDVKWTTRTKYGINKDAYKEMSKGEKQTLKKDYYHTAESADSRLKKKQAIGAGIGAGIGAAAGSVVPGIGTAFGTVYGAGVGYVLTTMAATSTKSYQSDLALANKSVRKGTATEFIKKYKDVMIPSEYNSDWKKTLNLDLANEIAENISIPIKVKK